MAKVNTKEVETKGRRGRKALEGLELIVPGLRSILGKRDISHYYKLKLAETGFIKLVAYKEPGTRGRPEMVPVITDKGLKFYEQHAENVKGYLAAA